MFLHCRSSVQGGTKSAELVDLTQISYILSESGNTEVYFCRVHYAIMLITRSKRQLQKRGYIA